MSPRHRHQARCHLVALALLVSLPVCAQDSAPTPYQLARERGCTVCHEVESPPRGAEGLLPPAPSFEDVARRYRSDPEAASRLSSIVRQGTGPLRRDRHWEGKAGFTAMLANDVEVTDAEARRIVDWILTLAPAQRPGSKRP